LKIGGLAPDLSMEGVAFRLKKIWILKDFKEFDFMCLTPEMPVDDALALLRWLKHFMYKGKLSPESEKNFKNILKGGGKTMKHAVEIWRDEMIDEATHKKAVEIAKYFKDKDVPVEDIAEATGLTIDEIIQL